MEKTCGPPRGVAGSGTGGGRNDLSGALTDPFRTGSVGGRETRGGRVSSYRKDWWFRLQRRLWVLKC